MPSKRKKRIWIPVAVTLAVLVLAAVVLSRGRHNAPPLKTVRVVRADIVQKALAVGAIEPRREVAVKSKISGVVRALLVEVGDYVHEGQPLMEIRPDPTPLELAEAKRNVELAAIEFANVAQELHRQQQLHEKGLISQQDYERLQRQYDEAELRHKIASERLALLEKGRVRIADAEIETTIRAPIAGYVLEKSVNVGDPVVPLTSYQAGTELMKLADMSELLFRGTVDEIDVGKIREGMHAEIQVGALPGAHMVGRVSLISLKAQKRENTTVFPLEISIDKVQGVQLRAGFSANAHILIARRDSVLAIPERVVTFRNDSAFVAVPAGNGKTTARAITVGLSDAIMIEVLSGLQEGEEVCEKPVHEIT